MRWAFLLSLLMFVSPATAAEPLQLHAAGSLRAALNEVIEAFTAKTSVQVQATYAPSGLLRERIAGGEASDLFASANMKHPKALQSEGTSSVVHFTGNRLCGLSRPGLGINSDNLLERMLDPDLRLAISTPGADPSGDYTWSLFGKAEAVEAGAQEALEEKALQLVGGPDSPQPPPDRTLYGLLLEQEKADLFLTYCTNAVLAAREVPGLEVIQVPSPLNVGASYGLIVLSRRPEAARLALFLLSEEGQTILSSYGFDSPLL
ncbi:MAG TPA: molybdate ABC transporter substrate-binding protein [Kiloniellales bacterium]|nr:molybdate ABC transporter substrate-binding protein [Kiloniellales bacterium]